MDTLIQILILLGVAVTVVVASQKMHIPSSLAYLLVGLIVGPFTVGPVVDVSQIRGLAEFGIVFLLFTIGLNFSLPEIYALRNRVFGLGTAQVVLTTVIVGIIAWLAGLDPAVAFVVGAVFAQSSSTIIGKQLSEQGEDGTRHGRLGLAMSVLGHGKGCRSVRAGFRFGSLAAEAALPHGGRAAFCRSLHLDGIVHRIDGSMDDQQPGVVIGIRRLSGGHDAG